MENESKKRILHVVGGMNIGGTETMLMNLYRKVNKNIQFDFISYYDKEAYYDDEIRKLGGNVINLQAPNKVGTVKAIKELMKVIKENGPYQAVHSHTLFNCGIANISAKLSGVDVRIAHAHTTLDNSTSFIRKIYISIMRAMIKVFSTDFLACSNSAGKYLFGEKINNKDSFKIIPNYIDYKEFLECDDSYSIRGKLGINKEDVLVAHVGRFINAKNHKFLVEVINNMVKKDERVKAILVGDGHLRDSIEKQVKALGLERNTFFLGVRKDINTILNNCDLFIFPSIYEGLGLVLLEAQGCGLPCLVSEAIQPEADLKIGLLKQLNLNNGAERWADEALELIDKKNKDKKLIEDAFKVNGYEMENIVNSLLDVYKIN